MVKRPIITPSLMVKPANKGLLNIILSLDYMKNNLQNQR